METIISSCVTAAVTLVICLLNNHGQQEKTRALMEYKLDELTKRVDKHNNVVERTYREYDGDLEKSTQWLHSEYIPIDFSSQNRYRFVFIRCDL